MPRPGLLSRLAERLGRGRVVSGALWSIGGNAAGATASFATQVLLARELEATRYGLYSYLLAWANVAILFGKLEFDTAAVRFVGAYDGQRQDGLLHGFLRYGWRLVLGTAGGVAVTAVVIGWLLLDHLPEGVDTAGIIAAGALVPLSAALMFSSSTLQGVRRVPQAQLPGLVLRPVLFGLGIVFVPPLLRVEVGPDGAVALNAAATTLALLASVLLLRRAIPASARAAPPVRDAASWLRTVRGLLVIAAANLVLSQQTDILIVGTLVTPRDAGLYSVASQLSTLIGLSATAVVFAVTPIISRLHVQQRRAELQRLVVRTVQGCALVSLPVAALLFAAGHMVLRWYGAGFEDAYLIMVILSGAQVLHATFGISGFLLTMTGHEWEASRVIVSAALLNLALTVALTPVLGPVGTATATVVAGVVKLALLRWYAQRYLGVSVVPLLPRGWRAAEGG